MKKRILLFFLVVLAHQLQAQLPFSIATDISVLRNFSPQQKFFSVGQTIQVDLHVAPRESVYGWISYFSRGRFRNSFQATALSPTTQPATLSYDVKGEWRFREISVGWKHWLKGTFDSQSGWSMYGTAGFGCLVGLVENIYPTEFDTVQYRFSPIPKRGSGNFTRLTADFGLGVEFPLGSSIYLYGDARTWLPITEYPSSLLHDPRSVPLPVMIGGGVRVMFGGGY